MTAVIKSLTGASSASDKWNSINWKNIEAEVYRLQMRIAKAVSEGRQGKVKALQWLLTHSFHAKMLAVKRVVQNKGGKTPGVDKIIWKTPQQKLEAAQSLKRKGYNTQPLKRIYIPKMDGRLRPLSIPTMKCRAMQALYLLALDPIAEFYADKNSYGFRPKRSPADALGACFNALARKSSAQWIFEADIKSCFDKISHDWLRENIPMDKEILNKWLSAGYIDQGVFHQTVSGTPQGGLASPTLLVLTLSGLEQAVHNSVSKRKDKVYLSIYADDFIITGKSKDVLEMKVRPVVELFLCERGLELSQEKTKITHVDDGFDFLGVNVRKYKGKYISKPSKKSVNRFLMNIREIIKANPTAKTENLIHLLNPIIRGWANYFRFYCAKETYSYIDHFIYKALWSWACRRHPGKGAYWIKRKYFRSQGLRNWIFTTKTLKDGKRSYVDLFTASSIAIKRHAKIRSEATPYDPRFTEYFNKRQRFPARIEQSRESGCAYQ
ncbi:group II intron reverse transcriptase/maturase [Legionella saoudiensis]|uniref:group II intron reverse transcriptase/maturase n=1 Tax=Legionella saoudiensis TaxID=1750561 RepID=UPI0007313BBE|nr:group II intron reverse transcriptase/maturase [Legionella saoudiensis]